jgi:hypothetical protein
MAPADYRERWIGVSPHALDSGLTASCRTIVAVIAHPHTETFDAS